MQRLWDEEDARALCKYFWDVDLTAGEEKIVKSVAFGRRRKVKRTIICCMTRYGKSYSVSMGILLWIFQNRNRKVAIIAPTNEKTTIIRNYIAQFISKSPIFSQLLDMDRTGIDRIRKEISKKRMTWKNGVEMRTLSAEGQGESLMGFGADMVVVDEECDIDYEVYRSKITRMLGESDDSEYVGIGNPWHRDNQMWEHWINPAWNKIHIDFQEALEEGRISEDFVAEQRATLTEREFEILYGANFPETSSDALIDWKWIDRAQKQEIVVGEKYQIIAGIDVAAEGNDLTVVTIVKKDTELNKYKVLKVDAWGKTDLMPTVGKILPILAEFNVHKVLVDSSGIGSGVFSRLEEIRKDGKLKCVVEKFLGGAGPSTDKAKEKFLNINAESFWHLRSLFEEGKIQIVQRPELVSQLSKMKWELTSAEKIRIRRPGQKEGDTAEKKSPDFADSLNIACWVPSRAGLSFGSLITIEGKK